MQKKDRRPALAANHRRGPPYIGALLRVTYQLTRRRLFEALMEKGLTDLNPALLNVLVYPPPDGVRPTELADRLNMTKQALNYLLGQLESLGYIERRTGSGSRRLVFLTRRGWQVFETHWEALRRLEDEWSDTLGTRKFRDLMDALRQLALPSLNELSAHAPDGEAGSRSLEFPKVVTNSRRRTRKSVSP
jgi:DNA-binding MarR family transcriptional regulator